MTKIIRSAALAIALATGPALAQSPPKADAARVAEIIKNTFKSASPEWQQRATQDETQRVCSETRNNPSRAEFDKIKAREAATVVFPPDGNVLGDWKKGVQVAQNGRGGQFSDPPGTVAGGNCYACHQMERAEVSYGTLGPSLLEYGKIRKFDANEARQAYAKIFNAQSVQACSNMPRFGYHKFLTIEQIKDVTAYLMSPDSPVNK